MEQKKEVAAKPKFSTKLSANQVIDYKEENTPTVYYDNYLEEGG